MRSCPTVFLCLFLLTGPLFADSDPDYPYAEGEAVSLRAAPPARVVSPGRTLVGDFDRGRLDSQGVPIGDPMRDWAMLDLNLGTISVMWRPGVAESLDVDIASNVADFGVRPGGATESDQLVVVDGQGLKLFTFGTNGWSSSLELSSWAGVQQIETYYEAGSGFQVFGLAPDGVTVHRMWWDGATALSEVVLVSPLPVIQLKPYDRSGTSDPGIAVMVAGGLGLYDLGGNLLASHFSPGWGCDAITTLSMDLASHEWIAWVVTVPAPPYSQYLLCVDEAGISSPRALWAGRNVSKLTSAHYTTLAVNDLYQDLVVTFQENDGPPSDDPEVVVLVNTGGAFAGPDFDIDELHSVPLTCPRGPDQTMGYQGMAAVADMDRDGDGDLIYATKSGRAIVFLNQRVSASGQRPKMLDFRADCRMAVAADITSQVTFSVPSEVPTGSDMFIQLETFRQTSPSVDTDAEPKYSQSRNYPGGTVQFGFYGDVLELDGDCGDAFGDGAYYYLVVRGVRRHPVTGRLQEVWPGQVYGLHVSAGVTGADDYLEDVADPETEFWWVNELRDGKIDGYVGRGRDLIMIPAIPYE